MSSGSENELEVPPTQGLVAGKYQVTRLIGRGGMGSVWEARHVSLGTKVAIKFVEVEQAKGAEARDRFQNEARAAASIQSKHAIKVYDHGLLDDGRPYIVMELLTGEPLDSRLTLFGRIPVQETARMVLQIARALQQAHDSGITHRDLKPENIFLVHSVDDDDEIAKVLDFGIAKLTDPSHALAVSSSTKTGVLMGTPYFMSPEQARGLKSVDFRSDLWALGVIVFRCVTGELPFTGEALGDLLVKICAAPIPVPSSVLPDVSPQFDAWMAKALQREPQDRFRTATEMAEALAMVAGISIRVPSRRSRSFPPPTAATMPETLATGRSPSTAATTPLMVTSSPLTASTVPPPQPGVSARLVLGLAIVGLGVAGGGTYFVMTRSQTTAITAAAHAPSSVSSAPPAAPSSPTASPPTPGAPSSEPIANAAPTTPPASPDPPPKPSTPPARTTPKHAPIPPSQPATLPPASPTPPAPRPVRPPTPSPASNDPGF